MGLNANPYSNTPIKNLEYIQNKALVIAPFEITKSGLLDTDLMLDTPGTITMYFFRKNFNNIDKEPTAEQFKTVGTISDISTKLGLDITAGNISSPTSSSYYLGFSKISVIFKYDKNTGMRTIEKDTSSLGGNYIDISIDSSCDLTTEDYFVICNVTKNTKSTNIGFTESTLMDFLFMIPSSECQEIITDFDILDANNKTINVKKYGALLSGLVADNDTTIEPAYQADFFGDGSNIATYLFDGNVRDLNLMYNGTATNITYGPGKFGQAAIFNGTTSYINTGYKTPTTQGKLTVSYWVYLDTIITSPGTIYGTSEYTNIFCIITAEQILVASLQATLYYFPRTKLVQGWNHIVVHHTTTPTLYINNQLVTHSSTNNSIGVNQSKDLWFGRVQNSYGSARIDQVRIFNRALNSNEVTSLYLNNGSNRVIKQDMLLEEQLTLTEVTGKTLTPSGNPLVVYDKDNGPVVKFVNNRDYFSLPGSNDFSFGTDDFTVESWVKFNNSFSTYSIQYLCGLNTTGGIAFGIENGNLAFGTRAVSFEVNYSWTPITGVWYHLAATRENGIMKLWINGSNVATKTNTKNLSVNTGTFYIGALTPDLEDNFYGNISQLHIIKGVSKYSTDFTPASRLSQTTNTVLLLQVDKPVVNTDKWTQVQLESVEPIQAASIVEQTGKVITNTGVTVDTTNVSAINKINSMYFNGSSALSIPASASYAFGTGNFTVELLVNINAYPSNQYNYTLLLSNRLYSAGLAGTWGINLYSGSTPGKLGFGEVIVSPTQALYSNTNLALNTWYHIAFVRNNGKLSLYIDGVLDATIDHTINYSDTTQPLLIGNSTDANGYFNGYMQDIRITKGVALYSSNFTPKTDLVKDTNTSLLIQSYQISSTIKDQKRKDFFDDKSMVACYMLDSNTNDETGFYNGTATNITYTDGKFGKGAIFNGSTSKISSDINLNSNNFSISFWGNLSNIQSTHSFILGTINGDNRYGIRMTNSGKLEPNIWTGVDNVFGVDANWSNYANTWTNYVFSIANNTCYFYINGELKTTKTFTNNVIFNGVNIGYGQGGIYNIAGQIDNVKIFNRTLTDSEVTSLYKETISPIITLETESETIASEPDFFNDKSNIATYLFEPEILNNKYTIDTAVFEAPKSSGNYTYFGNLQFWYNTQLIDIKAYLVDRNNARLELDGVVIGNLNQDNVWPKDNGIGDWDPNNIIKSSINNGSGTTNNSTKQTITITFSKDIKIDNISYVSYLTGLGGSNITTTLSYNGTQIFTNIDTTQYSTTHYLIPLDIIPDANDANGKYNGTATNITYGTGKFGNCAIFNGITSKFSNSELPLTNSMSISFWMKKEDFSQTWESYITLGKDNAGQYKYISMVRLNDTDKFRLEVGNGSNIYKLFPTVTTTISIDNNWHHYLLVIDNILDKISIYKDNNKEEIIGSFSSTVSLSGGNGLHICNPERSDGRYLAKGQLDNVRIFNRPLTQTEVQDLYRETKRVKYKAITLAEPASKFIIETQKEIKLLNYKTWTGTETDPTKQGYKIHPIMNILDHTTEEATFNPKYYLGTKYQRNLMEILSQGIKSKRTISNLKDMYLVDDQCIQTLNKINLLLENNQMIKLTERLYNLTAPLREKLNADVILEYLSTPVSGSYNSDIATVLKTSLMEDYNFTQEEITNLNDNLNTFKSRARIALNAPVVQGQGLDQLRFNLPKTFVDGNRSKTEKKNLLVFGTNSGFNKFNLAGYTAPYSNISKRESSAVLDYNNLTLDTPTLSSQNFKPVVDDKTFMSYSGSLTDATGKRPKFTGVSLSTTIKKFNDSSIYINNNYIMIPAGSLSIGTKDFTIETWINPTSIANIPIFSLGSYRTQCCFIIVLLPTGGVEFRAGIGNWNWLFESSRTTAANLVKANTWNHIVTQRRNGNLEIYVNGILSYTGIWGYNIPTSDYLYIGGYFGNSNITAYYDDITISNGVGRYASNFASNFTFKVPDTFRDILTNYKQQIPFTYIPLSTDSANTNSKPVFENLTDITGFNNSDIIIDIPNVL